MSGGKALRHAALALCFLGALSSAGHAQQADTVIAVLETSLGTIEVEVDVASAPLSAASFLAFLDSGRFNGGGFYRVVRPDNDNGAPVISVIQGGVLDNTTITARDRVAHETTEHTGIRHTDGVISLARGEPGTGTGGTFFICLGPQPGLDFGAGRNADRQGFAAFGRVRSGMEVVRAINAMTRTQAGTDPYVKGQILAEPVMITGAYRKASQR